MVVILNSFQSKQLGNELVYKQRTSWGIKFGKKWMSLQVSRKSLYRSQIHNPGTQPCAAKMISARVGQFRTQSTTKKNLSFIPSTFNQAFWLSIALYYIGKNKTQSHDTVVAVQTSLRLLTLQRLTTVLYCTDNKSKHPLLISLIAMSNWGNTVDYRYGVSRIFCKGGGPGWKNRRRCYTSVILGPGSINWLLLRLQEWGKRHQKGMRDRRVYS